MDDQERIEMLTKEGWYIREVVTYEVISPKGNTYGTGDDQDEAWQDTLALLETEKDFEAKRKLNNWNKKVASFQRQ